MIIKRTPQAASPLASWLSYLENLHSKTIDLGLERVSLVAARLGVLKPAPFVFTVAGTNGKGTTCRTLESILMAAGYKVGVYSFASSGALYRARTCAGPGIAGIDPHRLFCGD